MRRRSLTLTLALLGACDEPGRAVVRDSSTDTAGDAPLPAPERVGMPSAGDCASDRGGCSAYARCEPAGAGARRCVCAEGLRVKADQRGCEGLLLVSATPAGRAGAGASTSPALAAAGRYVAFASDARDLPSGAALPVTSPRAIQCFVRDVVTGRTAWVSARSDGGVATVAAEGGGCASPQLTADGRRVAFLAEGAIDLADPPTHPVPHAYVRDLSDALAAGAPRRLRLDLLRPLSEHTLALAMTRDGRRFAVASRARLVPAGGPAEYDVYLVTDDPPAVTAVTVNALGAFPPYAAECGGNNDLGPFSGDGEFLAFHGPRAYTPDDDDQRRDSYLRDLRARRTELLSGRRTDARPSGPCSYRGAGGIALSFDARYAIFYSDNPRVDDTLARDDWDYFLRDRAFPIGDERGLTRLHLGPLVLPETLSQSRDLAGLSDDGRVAAVVSHRRLDRADVTDVSPSPHLYLLDLSDRAAPLRGAAIVDVDASGTPSAPASLPFNASLAADGSAVAFVSNTPLLPADTNTLPDVYLRVVR